MSPVHQASLIDASLHSKQMLELLELRVGRNLIDYLVQFTIEVVAHACGSPSSQTKGTRDPRQVAFAHFVSNVLTRSEAKISVLLVSLVYMDRSRPFLAIGSQDYAYERVFLGALMCASKYTNDATLRNVHWAVVTGMFGRRDVGRVEREFLEVLDWDLGVSESDILTYHEHIIALYPRPAPSPPLHVSFVVADSDDHCFSDSDSDGSSSAPVTPATPAHHPAYTKSPHPQHSDKNHDPHHHHHHHSHASAIFHIPQLIPRHWRHSSHSHPDPQIPAPGHQVQIAT